MPCAVCRECPLLASAARRGRARNARRYHANRAAAGGFRTCHCSPCETPPDEPAAWHPACHARSADAAATRRTRPSTPRERGTLCEFSIRRCALNERVSQRDSLAKKRFQVARDAPMLRQASRCETPASISWLIVSSVMARRAARSPCSRAAARAPAFFPGPRQSSRAGRYVWLAVGSRHAAVRVRVHLDWVWGRACVQEPLFRRCNASAATERYANCRCLRGAEPHRELQAFWPLRTPPGSAASARR